MPPIHVKSADEFDSYINKKGQFGSSTGVIVDHTASWCGPCKMFAPVFEAAANKYPQITFLKVDVDELQDVAAKCGVRAMPTIQAYVNAEKIDEFAGADPRKFQSMLDTVSQRVSSTAGAGRKLGGADTSAPTTTTETTTPAGEQDEMAARRARMAAAAEARMRGATAP